MKKSVAAVIIYSSLTSIAIAQPDYQRRRTAADVQRMVQGEVNNCSRGGMVQPEGPVSMQFLRAGRPGEGLDYICVMSGGVYHGAYYIDGDGRLCRIGGFKKFGEPECFN